MVALQHKKGGYKPDRILVTERLDVFVGLGYVT